MKFSLDHFRVSSEEEITEVVKAISSGFEPLSKKESPAPESLPVEVSVLLATVAKRIRAGFERKERLLWILEMYQRQFKELGYTLNMSYLGLDKNPQDDNYTLLTTAKGYIARARVAVPPLQNAEGKVVAGGLLIGLPSTLYPHEEEIFNLPQAGVRR